MVSEYSTADLVQSELRSDTAFSSSTSPSLADVTNWIQEASSEIDEISSNVYAEVTRTVLIDWTGNLGREIILEHSPLISVTSVQYDKEEFGGTPDYADLSYGTYLEDSKIVLTDYSPAAGRQRIKIVYVSGYSSTPLFVQSICTKMITHRVLSTLINNNINEGNDGGSISVGSINIVEPESYGVNSYKQLLADIEAGKSKLISGFGVFRKGIHSW